MRDTTYNGWANYPTWNVKTTLWIDEGSHGYWRGQARDCYTDADGNEDEAITDLRDRLESKYDDLSADLTTPSGVFADLTGWALKMVDWAEIARSMISDIDDEERADLCPKDDDTPADEATD